MIYIYILILIYIDIYIYKLHNIVINHSISHLACITFYIAMENNMLHSSQFMLYTIQFITPYIAQSAIIYT